MKKEGLASPVSGKDLETVSPSRSQVVTVSKEPDPKEVQVKEPDVASIETHRSESAPKEESSTRPR